MDFLFLSSEKKTLNLSEYALYLVTAVYPWTRKFSNKQVNNKK